MVVSMDRKRKQSWQEESEPSRDVKSGVRVKRDPARVFLSPQNPWSSVPALLTVPS